MSELSGAAMEPSKRAGFVPASITSSSALTEPRFGNHIRAATG